MDQVIEFFKGLDALQWILLAGGLFLLWPTIQEKLGLNQGGGNVTPDEPTPDTPDVKPDTPDHPDHDNEYDLTGLVCKWECLCDACHENGLHDACGKLAEVFPMLVKPYEKEHKHED